MEPVRQAFELVVLAWDLVDLAYFVVDLLLDVVRVFGLAFVDADDLDSADLASAFVAPAVFHSDAKARFADYELAFFPNRFSQVS